MNTDVSVKKRGRPKKTDIVAKIPGKRNAVGRPKGEQAIINEYRSRMLNSPRSQKVVEAIYGAALDDNHKNQAAAWKLIMDRLLPLSHFEKDKNGGGRAAVSITITGVGGEQTIISGGEEAEDIAYKE
jgi:hypothetical protein